MVKKLLAFIFSICWVSQLSSQAAGVAGTKLYTLNTVPIPTRTLEFEPTFNVFRSNGSWTRNSFVDSDTVEISSNLSWRMAYGLSEKIELGANFQSDTELANFDLKYQIADRGAIKFGAVGGFTFPLGNRTYSKDNPSIDDVSNYYVGLVASFDLDSISSIDLNFQMVDYFRDVYEAAPASPNPFPTPIPNPLDPVRLTGTTYFLNAELGSYFLHDGIQTIAGAGYYTTTLDDRWEAAFYPALAIAFEMYENYVIVLGGSYNIWGKNQPQTLSLALTLTTIWE